MELLLIIALVVALYARTLRYNYMPDDIVRRDEYLYNVPESLPSHEFIRKVPPLRVRLWLIVNHCCNVAFIYVLFGWKPALVFAVHPVAVNATAWITGNYYAGTTLLVLAAYWCVQTFGWLGAIPAVAFYTAALNSTLTALGVPFFFLVTGTLPGIVLFAPLVMYLRGKRFNAGMKIRKTMRKKNFDKLDYRKLSFMTKVVFEYIGMFILPLRMGLFRIFGENVTRTEKFYKKDCAFNLHFLDSLLACVGLFAVGMYFNPMATLWFFCMIMPHSQFKVYGQSNPCNRYLYLPMIGLSILVSYLPSPLFYMFVGFLIYRTYLYIPAWKNQESLHRNNLTQFPERALSHSDYAQFVLTNNVNIDKQINRINEAAFYIQEAKRITDADGQLFEVYLNYAFFLSSVGNMKGALESTSKAITVGREQGVHGNLEKTLIDQEAFFKNRVEEMEKKEKETK